MNWVKSIVVALMLVVGSVGAYITPALAQTPVTHSALTGQNLHQAFHYEQASDPGNVGANKWWFNTTTGQLFRRDSTDTSWITVGQIADADLTAIAALVCTDNQIIKRSGGVWVCAADLTTPASVTITETFALSGDISPPQITSNQNNYDPTGLSTASVLRISTDAPRDITGVAGGFDGRVLLFHNIGSSTVTFKNLSGSSSAINQFDINSDVILGQKQVSLVQYDSTSQKWRIIAGAGSGGGQAADNDLTALAALNCTGIVTRTGTEAFTCRTITASGGVQITDGGGVGAAPAISMDATGVRNNQSNAYTTGDQNFSGATSLTVPASTSCDSQTTDGRICRDTDDSTLRVVLSSTNERFVFQSTLNALSILSLDDLDQDALPTVYPCLEMGSGPPPAGGVNRPGCVYIDTTVGDETFFFGATAGGNYINPGRQSDSYFSLSDLTNAANATGGEGLILVTDTNLPVTAYAIDLVSPGATAGTPGGPFNTQPANDAVQFVSSSASDTGSCTIIGNTNGADKTVMIRETIALTGTTPVTTVKTNWGEIVHIDCSSFTPVGTITAREDSGDVTITQMNATFKKASVSDGFITKPGGGAGATINQLHVWTANQGEPPPTSFCTIGARNAHPVQNCATGESIRYSGILNRAYSGGNIVVVVWYSMATAVANNVEVTTSFERIGAEVQDLDIDGFATGIPSSDSVVPGTSGHLKKIEITHTNAQIDSLAVGEPFRINIQRSTPTGTDASGDMQIKSVELRQ